MTNETVNLKYISENMWHTIIDSKVNEIILQSIGDPEQWFFDNQLIWSQFRTSHFTKTLEVLGP